MSSTTTKAVQIFSISTSLLSSGALFAFSLFDIPELKSQPASRSLPSIRWFFSRGSHIFPQAALLSGAGFIYLAYAASPIRSFQTLASSLQLLRNPKISGYIVAALSVIGIAPFTTQVMVPTNFAIIQLNKDLGGASSQQKAREGRAHQDKSGTDGPADVDGAYEKSEFTDLSPPMGRTEKESTKEQDERSMELLDKFGKLNLGRAVLMLVGGVAGLVTSLP